MARIGSRDNSVGFSSVSLTGLPISQVAKSWEYSWARNLERLSNMLVLEILSCPQPILEILEVCEV
jgi:hypothetical protein